MKKLISTALVSIIIFNQVMAMDILNKKEENIVRVATFAAAGDQQKLKAALADGLDSGVSVNEFKEILVQTYAYCGFPRSLNALGTFMNLLKERGGKDEIGKEPSALPSGSSLDFGAKNQTKLVGREVKGELFDFAPAIDQYLKAHLFGDIFARDNLDWRTRELATIAMLAAIDGVKPQLNAHIAIGKNNGVDDAQAARILEIVENEVRGKSNTSPFAFGDENTAYAKYFSGKSYLARLSKEKDLGVPLANVTF